MPQVICPTCYLNLIMTVMEYDPLEKDKTPTLFCNNPNCEGYAIRFQAPIVELEAIK